MNLYIGIALVFLGQAIGWFQLNSQYMSEWWSDKPWITALILGAPCSVAFWYSWRFIVDETGSAWTARFIGSSAGLIIFPILTLKSYITLFLLFLSLSHSSSFLFS